MRRRDYLTVLATGAAGVTGYATGNQQTDDGLPPENGTGNATTNTTGNETGLAECPTETPADDSLATNTETGTSTGGSLEIVATDYVEIDEEFSTMAGVWVEVANHTDQPWSYVELGAAFRDGQGTIIADRSTNTGWLPAGETWRVFISHPNPEQVETADVSITDTTRGEVFPTADELGLMLDGVELVDSGPTVVGEVTNTTGGPIDYLTARVAFHGDEYFYGSGSTIISGFAADDTWRFEVDLAYYAPEDPAVTDYTLRFET